MTELSFLASLVGAELSSVIFVRDYLQLDFGGPRFTCLVWPVVVAGQTFRNRVPGYRDAICSLINDTVTATEEASATGLVLHFGHTRLVLDPSPEEIIGAEIATLHLHDDKHQWMAWRPGESPFTDSRFF